MIDQEGPIGKGAALLLKEQQIFEEAAPYFISINEQIKREYPTMKPGMKICFMIEASAIKITDVLHFIANHYRACGWDVHVDFRVRKGHYRIWIW